MPTITRNSYAPLSPSAAKLARQSGAEIERLARSSKLQAGDATVRLNIEITSGEMTAVSLPEATLGLIASVLNEASRGRQVNVVSADTELTTQQAADMLGVSRPYFVKLLTQGLIPYRSVGVRRRVQVGDLFDYKEHESAKRLEAVDEMVAQNERLGLY